MQKKIKQLIVLSDEGDTIYGLSDFKFTRTYAELEDGEHIQVHSESKVGDNGSMSEEWSAERVEQFLKTDKNCFEDYCRGGGEQHKTHDLLGFMDWVDKMGFHFDQERTLLFEICEAPRHKNIKEVWSFHGNLHEYSSAFSFTIFDPVIANIATNRLRENGEKYQRSSSSTGQR